MSIIEMIIGALAMLGIGTGVGIVLGVVITRCCVVSGRKNKLREINQVPWEDKEENDD